MPAHDLPYLCMDKQITDKMQNMFVTETHGGITTVHYKDFIHYCRVTDNTPCHGITTDHIVVYIFSGEMQIRAAGKTYRLKKGDAYLLCRNHMNRKESKPLANGEPFEGVFFYLTIPMLRQTMRQQNLSAKGTLAFAHKPPFIPLPHHPFIDNLFASLRTFFKSSHCPDERLMDLKMQEIVLTLIEIKPELHTLLFDFAAPMKINLKDFMEQSYTKRLTIAELAYYAGRSPATFKTDFATEFHMPPGRWIMQRRLEEARRRMNEEGKRPSEVYREVGFKTLSHFSTAFRRQFGYAPSEQPGNG